MKLVSSTLERNCQKNTDPWTRRRNCVIYREALGDLFWVEVSQSESKRVLVPRGSCLKSLLAEVKKFTIIQKTHNSIKLCYSKPTCQLPQKPTCSEACMLLLVVQSWETCWHVVKIRLANYKDLHHVFSSTNTGLCNTPKVLQIFSDPEWYQSILFL